MLIDTLDKMHDATMIMEEKKLKSKKMSDAQNQYWKIVGIFENQIQGP